MQKITVTEGEERWISEIGGPRSGPMKIKLLVPWIIGNWGYNAGEVVEVTEVFGKKMIQNGKAREYTDIPETPAKRKGGWPKGKPRKKKSEKRSTP